MYYAMYQQAKGKHSLRSQYQDSPCTVCAHRRWQEAKEKRASPGGERQHAALERHVSKEAFPSKTWKQNSFPAFYFFSPNGCLRM